MLPILMSIGHVHDAKLQEGFVTIWILELPFFRINVLRHMWKEIALRQYPMLLQWIMLSMRCYVLDHIFVLL